MSDTSQDFSHLPTVLQQALAASAKNDSNNAIRLFLQAATENPAMPLPHFLLASEYASLGEMEKAEASFANTILLAPSFAVARYQLGLLQFSSGRAALALVTWQPLLNLSDTDPMLHFVRGFAALAHDQFEEALSNYRAGLERNTANPAMSSDILLIVERVEALLKSQNAAKIEDKDAKKFAEEENSTSHVLLSNYQKQNPSH